LKEQTTNNIQNERCLDDKHLIERIVINFCGDIVLAWWSAGITSAVACKITLELYENVQFVYIKLGKAHPDNERFKRDCEAWYGKKIWDATNSNGYADQMDVIRKTGFVNGAGGARCTLELKKEVRFELERLLAPNLFSSTKIVNQIFGYEWDQKQVNRAIRFLQQYPTANGLFPLIDRKMNKANCAAVLLKNNIELPWMYRNGYNNNNCIGCVKGGKGYWNKIRTDFPEVFYEMMTAERLAGHSCIKNKFLDELKPGEGRRLKEVMPECGEFCEVELGDIEHKNVDKVMNGEMTVYEAA
jgi:3'-phosphoadenosine 5'-phosphosulfate sulfotransferase (PAPS reductase)/FAD synthetase